MKTAKEKIQQDLGPHVVFEYGGDITILPSGLNAGVIEKMMQEHAKEVSMNFGKWVDINAVRNGVDAWTVGSGNETQRYTTEELFDKFMKEYPAI